MLCQLQSQGVTRRDRGKVLQLIEASIEHCAIYHRPALQYGLLLAPVILYGLFNVYRNIYNPKATFLVRWSRG